MMRDDPDETIETPGDGPPRTPASGPPSPEVDDDPTRTLPVENEIELPDRYLVLGTLGRGGMGKVLHARDRTLDREVAVKVISEIHARDEKFVRRFLHEARTAARLNRPDIVQIYEFGETGGSYFLVMEYVDGTSLGHDLKKNGRFTESETIDLARRACRALGAAHAAGIIHRDVKPDNLMRSGSGEFKLVDLGLAKSETDDETGTRTGQSMGTPHYISPEQVLGSKDIDLRTDLYSLGATMFHLATGRFPFEGQSGAHVMSRHLNDPVPNPRQHVADLTDGLCRVIDKLMAKDPAERHSDSAALEEDLSALARGELPSIAAPLVSTVDPSRHTPAPPLDGEDLSSIESALAHAIGPLARVLVGRAVKKAPSREDLCRELAKQIPDAKERQTFLDTTSSQLGSKPGQSRVRTSPKTEITGVAPAPSHYVPARTTSWDPALLTSIETLLAKEIGPIARVLVRREAKKTTQRAALADALAEHIRDKKSATRFRSAVETL